MKTNKVDVEKILDDLSYSWSSPEAEHFQECIKTGQDKKAEKMLKEEGLNKESVQAVMEYFKEKYTAKKVLVEVLPKDYETLKENDIVLVSYGSILFSTRVSHEERYTDHKGLCFFDKEAYHYVPLTKATQVWKVEVVKS